MKIFLDSSTDKSSSTTRSFNSVDFLLVTDSDVLGSILVLHLLALHAGHVVGEQAGIVLWVSSAQSSLEADIL